MKRLIAVLLAVMLLAAMLTGCGNTANDNPGNTNPVSDNPGSNNASSDNPAPAVPTTNPEVESKTGGITDLRVGMFAEPSTLDPAAVSLQANNCTVEACVFVTLFDYDSSTGGYYLYAATDYEWQDDYHLQITIRDDIYSHTGKHITAEDVAFCLNRCTENPALGNTFQDYVPGSFAAVDETTLTLETTTINYAAWQTLALAVSGIYSQEDFESVGEENWARNPIGCGPYVFDRWVAGSEIVLTRNDKFWGDEPVFDSIIFKFIPDTNARTLALQSGDIDFAENIGAAMAPTLEGLDGIQLYYNDIGETQVIWFNCLDNEALRNPDVRKALEYGTNKEAILYTIYNGLGSVSDSIFTTMCAQYREPSPENDRSYDPEKAKEMLAEAGYADGLTLDLSCYESTAYQDLLTMIKQQWSEIGVTCNISTYDRGAYFERLYAGQFDVYTIHNVGLDPSLRLINYRSFLSRNDGNLTGFANTEYDELVTNSFKAKTTEERDALVMDAADLLRDECPFFSVVDTFQVEAGVAGFGNVDNGPTSYMVYYHFTK